MNTFLIDLLTLGAIFSALLVVTSKNPVMSVLFLISLFMNVSGYLVLLGLGFLGISYLIIYIGAIAILFLFVVMMLNLQLAELNAMASEYTQNLPLGAIFVFLLFTELFTIFPFSSNGEYKSLNPFKIFPDIQVGLLNTLNSIVQSLGFPAVSQSTDVYLTFNNSTPDVNLSSLLEVQSIGFTLYTFASVWLFVASLVLLLAMIGPIVLTLKVRNSVNLVKRLNIIINFIPFSLHCK
uniref:NADH-ubiquinone oxidoreductase chain 6 n=1 Tax=Malassezia japonica TaxID=223818 RepID=A0A2I6QCJ9_9BASI|nr:NADH dehydrogenase subunit 6 [Malassezia japonica]